MDGIWHGTSKRARLNDEEKEAYTQTRWMTNGEFDGCGGGEVVGEVLGGWWWDMVGWWDGGMVGRRSWESANGIEVSVKEGRGKGLEGRTQKDPVKLAVFTVWSVRSTAWKIRKGGAA